VIAHVGGLPVEEVLPALMSGGGVWLILRLTSQAARLRRPTRHPRAVQGAADGGGPSSRDAPEGVAVRTEELGAAFRPQR
jgi:hypothetical protein